MYGTITLGVLSLGCLARGFLGAVLRCCFKPLEAVLQKCFAISRPRIGTSSSLPSLTVGPKLVRRPWKPRGGPRTLGDAKELTGKQVFFFFSSFFRFDQAGLHGLLYYFAPCAANVRHIWVTMCGQPCQVHANGRFAFKVLQHDVMLELLVLSCLCFAWRLRTAEPLCLLS